MRGKYFDSTFSQIVTRDVDGKKINCQKLKKNIYVT